MNPSNIPSLSYEAAFFVMKKSAEVGLFANMKGVLATLEGNVTYQAGDALMSGPHGERWPIPRKRFIET